MLSGLGAAALGVAGNLLGTGLSNMSANNATKKAYKYNMWMWNAQNEYNLPVNQMKRLEDAGLNPNLVYGHGTSTLASTPSSAGTPSRYPYQLDGLTALNAYQDLRQKDATTQNIRAQAQVIKAQQREIDARTDNVNADTKIKLHNYGIVKGTPLFVGEGGTVSQVGRGVNAGVTKQGFFSDLANGVIKYHPGLRLLDYAISRNDAKVIRSNYLRRRK